MFGKHDDKQQNRPMKRFLVTGSAGFIGFHVAKRLLREGNQVTGLDNLNTYYDVNLKRARLAQLRGRRGFRFVMADVADRAQMERLFQEEPFDCVIHLAAQAGVRYSLTNRTLTSSPTWSGSRTCSKAAGTLTSSTSSSPLPVRCTEPTS